jgi:hypothetical protein
MGFQRCCIIPLGYLFVYHEPMCLALLALQRTSSLALPPLPLSRSQATPTPPYYYHFQLHRLVRLSATSVTYRQQLLMITPSWLTEHRRLFAT